MDSLIWDPLRKKNVALTPEERVRQWFIEFLNKQMKVPFHLMMSETSLQLGQKHFRADILVYDRNAAPLAIVECKREDVEIDEVVLDQAVRYNMVLKVKYIIITNGNHTYMCERQGGKYVFLDHTPVYDEMVDNNDRIGDDTPRG